MSGAAADNDILYKGAWYGLLHELLGVIPCLPEHTLVRIRSGNRVLTRSTPTAYNA